MYTNYDQIMEFFTSRKQFGIKLGLDRMRRLLSLLDNPQNKLKAIHVAGTNGKGSTISYLENALIENSYNVGVFTSPSLSGLTGHIFCNGKVIATEEFILLFNNIYPAIQQLDKEGDHPTEFEIMTSLAFVYFSKNVDISLIETGMGGLEDTTNCLNPILSIITNISQDHTGFLGQSVAKISEHKSGVIKNNIPVIIGNLDREALSVVKRVAKGKRASIFRLDKDFSYTNLQQDKDKQLFTWTAKNITHKMMIKMKGEHQVKNCSLSIMALVLLKENGFMINWKKSIRGIIKTYVPGRFEIIKKNPTIILDGAHNLAGIEAFLQTVHTSFRNTSNHLIFAAFKDKDLPAMLNKLSPHFSSITLTTFKHPRAASAQQLYDLTNIDEKRVVSNWERLIQEISSVSLQDHPHYFITGSLHFIGEIRELFINT